MTKFQKFTRIAMVSLILLTIAISVVIYPKLPDQIASNFSAQGEVNSYIPKVHALFMYPILMSIFAGLYFIIPKINPKKRNEKVVFEKDYEAVWLAIQLFIFYIFCLVMMLNLGYRIDLLRLLVAGMSILFIALGFLIQETKQNWFIGIRTPWTLSNEKVWVETHKIGGKLFIVAGIVSLLGCLIQEYTLWISLFSIIFVSLFSVLYSYYLYQKIK